MKMQCPRRVRDKKAGRLGCLNWVKVASWQVKQAQYMVFVSSIDWLAGTICSVPIALLGGCRRW